MRVRFGDFVFDSRLRELRSGATVAHLTPKAFALLETLLQARPRPVSKEYLYEHLWPQTYVGDTNLKMLVSVLRIVLGDDSRNPTWVKTVYGFGYAFASENVIDLPEQDDETRGSIMFRLLIGEQVFALSPGSNIIGREDDANVVIDSDSVSRHHAVIVIRGEDALIEDLGSKNGTFIASRRIEAAAGLKDGDTIRLGSVALTFRAQHRSSPTVTYVED
jgi:DNA-binding winged helix-turn-helix (wHTH) protein